MYASGCGFISFLFSIEVLDMIHEFQAVGNSFTCSLLTFAVSYILTLAFS